jgi:rRNA-processing protein FCF1
MNVVFVDTNVLLSFYAFTSDDLVQLEKLVAELKAKKIRLLITDQVYDEFRRNREGKIAEALKNFVDRAGIDSFPRMIQHYDEFKALSDAAEQYKKLRSAIAKHLESDIQKKTLPADAIVDEILSVAGIIESTPEIIDSARLRMSIGKPPGKKGSLGDAINWELLLQSCEAPCDLHIVTNDKDFLSPVSGLRLNEYLADEWRARCKGEVKVFSTLRDMLKAVAPDIQLSVAANTVPVAAKSQSNPISDDESSYIEDGVNFLANSANFRRTHAAIEQMPNIRILSPDQVARLFRASVENNDIAWIHSDDDVQRFFRALYATYPNLLEDDIQEDFKALFG